MGKKQKPMSRQHRCGSGFTSVFGSGTYIGEEYVLLVGERPLFLPPLLPGLMRQRPSSKCTKPVLARALARAVWPFPANGRHKFVAEFSQTEAAMWATKTSGLFPLFFLGISLTKNGTNIGKPKQMGLALAFNAIFIGFLLTIFE